MSKSSQQFQSYFKQGQIDCKNIRNELRKKENYSFIHLWKTLKKTKKKLTHSKPRKFQGSYQTGFWLEMKRG